MSEVVTLHKGEPPANRGFCLTPTARDITSLLTFCKQYGQIGVVVGDPGTGKTTAVRAFQEAQDGVVYCRMTKASSKLQPGLVRLASAFDVQASQNGGAHELYQSVSYAMQQRSDLMLVIDEAQYMDDELLETIRDFYDEHNDARSHNRLGLALVGNYGLTDRWADRSPRRRNVSNFKQLRGRLGPVLDFAKPSAEDIASLCEHHGIVGKQSCALVAKASNAPGGLHNAANLVRVAKQLSEQADTISYRSLEEAAIVTGVKS
jgi:hypothetical protein